MSTSSSSSPELFSASQAPTDLSAARYATMYETEEDVLEDLTSRFILNLPDEELNSIERISFQVEQAHWYYEDFIREANPKLPSLPLKKFSAMLFNACPLLHREDHEQAFYNFMQYKTRVPVCGAIMLNDTWEKCVLVKGWKSSSGWGFPKGKINEDEPQPNCAIREVLEETGYNIASQLNPDNVIEMSIKEQKIALYVVPGVPEDFPFKTKTRKEISKIEWFRLSDLPTWKRNKTTPGKFYLISPFIGALKQFIKEHKPVTVPRKPPKAKKVQIYQSPSVARHEPTLADSPSSSSQEANQESSSQSSSAENGEPQTPSPRSIPTFANHVDVVDTSALDPHFARLLNGLTLSEAVPGKQEIIAKSPTPQLPPPQEYASEILTEINQKPSTPLRTSSTTVSGNLSMADVTPIGHHSRNSPAITLETTAFSPPLRMTSNSSTSLSGDDNTITSPLSSASSAKPFRGTSRRTSSTADISPYLSKAPEIPSSAKHLKQIAVLEAAANESARMSPILQMRDAVVSGVAKEHMERYPQSLASQSILPQPIPQTFTSSAVRGHDLLYSSAPMGVPGIPPPPVLGNTTYPSMYDDPFVIRPRTSQASHRASYAGISNVPGSMSMTHSQLSTMMNLPRTSSVLPMQMSPGQTQYRFPPPVASQPHYPTNITSPNQIPPYVPTQYPVPSGPLPPLPPLQVPMSAPALSPVFNVPSLPSQGPSTLFGNPLLSILNGNPNPNGNTIIPGPYRGPA
ncbi:DCP2-domain-containing protein [Lentinula raphanica]|nr:DCP2-domain-containing protein [Lentinula raphanica]KAJ3975334.1 DCP2-domain-containing protein [Lentinula raphanica]